MVICTTCSVHVNDENKTAHFKSDWHVYNLKRVVAKLPPIAEDAYESKKISFKNDDASVEKKTHCQVCKRSFLNNKSFEAHLTSGKHIKNVRLKGTLNGPQPNSSHCLPLGQLAEGALCPVSLPADSGETESTSQALSLGSCLFCDKRILTSDEGIEPDRAIARRILAHMTDVHKFVVPYPDRLVDPAGLLLELGRIVGEERACLYCGRQFYGRRFPSAPNQLAKSNAKVSLMAVRNHMLHKDGHLRLWCGTEDPVEMALAINRGELEQENCSDDERYISPNAALAGGELYSQFYDQSVVIPSFIMPPDVGDDAYEIRLPSGTVISHRTMQTVYRQHLGNSLCLVDQQHQSLSGRRHNALPIVLSGERLSLQSRCRSSVLALPPGRNPIPLVSRATERRREDWSKRFYLETGLQGNLVNRMHIRRQY